MAAIIPVTPAPVECSFDMANTRNSYLSDDVNNILLNTFYNNRKKPYQVFLNADNVIWERDKMKKGSPNSYGSWLTSPFSKIE